MQSDSYRCLWKRHRLYRGSGKPNLDLLHQRFQSISINNPIFYSFIGLFYPDSDNKVQQSDEFSTIWEVSDLHCHYHLLYERKTIRNQDNPQLQHSGNNLNAIDTCSHTYGCLQVAWVNRKRSCWKPHIRYLHLREWGTVYGDGYLLSAKVNDQHFFPIHSKGIPSLLNGCYHLIYADISDKGRASGRVQEEGAFSKRKQGRALWQTEWKSLSAKYKRQG